MKIFAALWLMLAASYCCAQDYPRFELSAGYSYGSVDTQGYGTQRQAQGWSTSFAGNLRKWVGVEAEVSGRYNVLDFDFQGNALTSNSRYYTFLLGPRFAYRKGKAIPFVHSLFGIDRAPSYDQTVYDPAAGIGTTPYVTGLASAIGGGMDYAIGRRLTFRTQGDYFFTRHAAMVSPTPNNFRVQAAIVFTFGGGESLEAKRRRNAPIVAAQAPPAPPANPPSVSEPATAANVSEVPASAAVVPELPAAFVGIRTSPAMFNAVATPAPVVVPPVATQAIESHEAMRTEDVKTVASEAKPVPSARTITEPPAKAPVTTPAPIVAAAPAPKPEVPVVSKVTPPVVEQQTAPQAPNTSIAAVIAANPHSVLVSQSPDLYQPVKNEESLGDVARRYREKKRNGTTSNGL